MFAYDKTFDPKVVLGQYDLISRFSDFPLYLGTIHVIHLESKIGRFAFQNRENDETKKEFLDLK